MQPAPLSEKKRPVAALLTDKQPRLPNPIFDLPFAQGRHVERLGTKLMVVLPVRF